MLNDAQRKALSLAAHSSFGTVQIGNGAYGMARKSTVASLVALGYMTWPAVVTQGAKPYAAITLAGRAAL